MEPVDAERARQLSLFRPLGTVPLPCSEPLIDLSLPPWRFHWFWGLPMEGQTWRGDYQLTCVPIREPVQKRLCLTNSPPTGYQRNSCGYCKSDDGSMLFAYPDCLWAFFSPLVERLADTSLSRRIILHQLCGRAPRALRHSRRSRLETVIAHLLFYFSFLFFWNLPLGLLNLLTMTHAF